MNRHVPRVTVIVGWLAGMTLLLLVPSLAAGLACLAASVAAAVTFRWWGAWLHGTYLGVRLRLKVRQAAKTGGTLERA